jgi:hypothetical protein
MTVQSKITSAAAEAAAVLGRLGVAGALWTGGAPQGPLAVTGESWPTFMTPRRRGRARSTPRHDAYPRLAQRPGPAAR